MRSQDWIDLRLDRKRGFQCNFEVRQAAGIVVVVSTTKDKIYAAQVVVYGYAVLSAVLLVRIKGDHSTHSSPTKQAKILRTQTLHEQMRNFAFALLKSNMEITLVFNEVRSAVPLLSVVAWWS